MGLQDVVQRMLEGQVVDTEGAGVGKGFQTAILTNGLKVFLKGDSSGGGVKDTINHEVAVWDLAFALGMECVPPVIRKEVQGKTWAVMLFVTGQSGNDALRGLGQTPEREDV